MTHTHVGKTCPYCQTPIKPDVPIAVCNQCHMPHHVECWQENGRCTTFGCSGSVAPQPQALRQEASSDGYLSCPTCGYMMTPTEVSCPRCENLAHRQQLARAGARTAAPIPPPPQAPPYPSPYPPPQAAFGPLPAEYCTWSWGAFGCSWIWAAAMSRWGWFAAFWLVGLIPYAGTLACIGMAIYLGINGNALAWQSRRWMNLEHFRATQDVWKVWGIVFCILGAFGLIATLLALIALA